MPLMRIRSVEIVFEDEMSIDNDTALMERGLELTASDSDDSTKCVEDLEHLQGERDDSVTLNADLSDDNSFTQDALVDLPKVPIIQISDETHEHVDSLIVKDDMTLSLNISELGDSGRFTEEASSSHVDRPIVTYDDAVLSHSFDSVNTERMATMCEISEVSEEKNRLYEYIDSNSDSSDTAICDEEHPGAKHVSLDTNSDDTSLCESYDLQYDSFVDIGKF